MGKTVADKMGLKDGQRTIFVNAPPNAINAISLPDLAIAEKLNGMFDYVHLFVITVAEFTKQFPRLKTHLAEGGMLWVSWPKNKQLDTDSLSKYDKM